MKTGFDLCRAAMSVTDVTGPERTLLLVLAVMANDEAQAWPPISGPAGLTAKCVLSERAVQRAVQQLCSLGHISRRQLRHGVVYTVHPKELTPVQATPVAQSPVRETPDTGTPDTQAARPVAQAPKLPETTNTSSEATPPSKARAAKPTWPCPDGVNDEHWRDFLANRKSKRLGLTPSALAGQLRALDQLSDDEWPPGRLVQHAAERGWGAIHDPRDRHHGQRSHHHRPANDRPRNPLVAAAADDLAHRAGYG